ncbi:hypothetical protein [Streptomyces sp. NRRL B-24720]|uniref:hypothetical protein n=1 Tax=Streptomyces sp. NRRL B-24720 TaxID=1476876 RepID=UPI001F217ACF|nr:hypothetical protein [Streptomyces sp. NRRL B-24720]
MRRAGRSPAHVWSFSRPLVWPFNHLEGVSVKARFGVSRGKALAVSVLAAIVASTLSGSVSALADTNQARSEHWGVIARNTIGSPVADLRDGPYGSYDKTGTYARPPYGQGSLGIAVEDNTEKAEFGNEVDFYGDPVLGLKSVGFRVFQTGENVLLGGSANLPNIRFEIDPNLTSLPATNYASLVWVPAAFPTTYENQWSPYIDATTNGHWFLTGAAGGAIGCAVSCTWAQIKTGLDDSGSTGRPTILTAAVSKGRDNAWVGAIDGLRINQNIYDFEADGVRTRRVN